MAIQVKDAFGANQTIETPVGLTVVGPINETAAVNDTAAAGLNGRLQRIAINLTSYLSGFQAKFPSALGASGGLKVDGSGTPLPISGSVGLTGTPTVTVTGVPTTAADRGAGPATTNTMRVAIVEEQIEGGEYVIIPSTPSTVTPLGTTGGAVGDFLASILLTPGTTSPGLIAIKDGALTAHTVFFGGPSSVSNLVPFDVPISSVSKNGPWQIVTGTGNIQGLAKGNFT